MIRFIFKWQRADSMVGCTQESHFTVLADCPEVEKQLKIGGSGEHGWESVFLIGAEVVPDKEEKP